MALLKFRDPKRAAVRLTEEQESRILVRKDAMAPKATVQAG
jgi:hypothetical protein